MRTKENKTAADKTAKTVKGSVNPSASKEAAEGKKTAEKPTKQPKEKRVTIASKLDEVISKGGQWDKLVEAAQAEAKKLGSNMKFNAGLIRAHIAYREKKNPKYLGNLKVTDKGVLASVKKAA